MPETTIRTRIILRNDLASNWESVKDTVILKKGEPAIEFLSDSSARMKVGDGVTVYGNLPYVGSAEGETGSYKISAVTVGTDTIDMTIVESNGESGGTGNTGGRNLYYHCIQMNYTLPGTTDSQNFAGYIITSNANKYTFETLKQYIQSRSSIPVFTGKYNQDPAIELYDDVEGVGCVYYYTEYVELSSGESCVGSITTEVAQFPTCGTFTDTVTPL